jgi:Tol biopolymer transport system component
MERRITADPAFDGYPVLSPDGHSLVWQSNRGGYDGLWLTRVNVAPEPAPQPLTSRRMGFVTPRFVPNGGFVVAAGGGDGGFDIYRVPVPLP